MEHVFANSYGLPFVGTYTPPPCTFNRVSMNFTVATQGRQFDRLGIMYLGDIEVFRTSTAEPTPNGIVWTYVKEMEQFNALWKTDQKIIFDLPNIVNDIYTGPLSTTVTATFFTVPDSPPAADTILPLSTKASAAQTGSAFIVPGDNASLSYTFPQNVERAVVSLSACGQQAEEFWYTNVFSSDTNAFESTVGTLSGFSPFREIQLLIDGQLAGVSWPFPIIFTGGIAPGLWRPIVGIDAFDLRQHEIDITPWLPILCDGVEHTFEIRVAGLDDDGRGHASLSETVGSYWLVTGTIFLFLDREGSITTGSLPKIIATAPAIEASSVVTTDASGSNETLTYTTSVSRHIRVTSTLKTSTGSRPASWLQDLGYRNDNVLSSQGLAQVTVQTTHGADNASSGYANIYAFPLTVNSSFHTFPGDGFAIDARIDRGLVYDVYGPSVFPSGLQNLHKFDVTEPSENAPDSVVQTVKLPSSIPPLQASLLSTTQTGSAQYRSTKALSYSFGTTTQDYEFQGGTMDPADAPIELYRRHVKAVNSSVVEDKETLAGKTVPVPARLAGGHNAESLAALGASSVRSILGRGPGRAKGGYASSVGSAGRDR
ncbi:MAG: hypothetical protein Q9163_004807 [Psora crenata]